MEHYVRVIFETPEDISEALNESIFPGNDWLETDSGGSVLHVPLTRELSEQEADEFAERIADYMFEQGYSEFEVEISGGGQ